MPAKTLQLSRRRLRNAKIRRGKKFPFHPNKIHLPLGARPNEHPLQPQLHPPNPSKEISINLPKQLKNLIHRLLNPSWTFKYNLENNVSLECILIVCEVGESLLYWN